MMHPNSATYIKISRFYYSRNSNSSSGFNSWVGNYLILGPLSTPTKYAYAWFKYWTCHVVAETIFSHINEKHPTFFYNRDVIPKVF